MPAKNPFSDAAEILASKDLTKGTYGHYVRDDGTLNPATTCCCTTGALMLATGLPYRSDQMKALALKFCEVNAIPLMAHDDGMSATFRWNDKPERTKQEVINALRKAANS